MIAMMTILMAIPMTIPMTIPAVAAVGGAAVGSAVGAAVGAGVGAITITGADVANTVGIRTALLLVTSDLMLFIDVVSLSWVMYSAAEVAAVALAAEATDVKVKVAVIPMFIPPVYDGYDAQVDTMEHPV